MLNRSLFISKRLFWLFLLIAVSMPFNVWSQPYPSKTITTQEDHQNMKEQLGIKTLRPGLSGNESAPNHANYDQKLADPCPSLAPILVSNKGEKIINAQEWYRLRRGEIAAEFEKNVYGKVPANIPTVSWKIKVQENEIINRIPVVAKEMIGHIQGENTEVNIKMVMVLPINVKGPVPVLIMFGRPSLPAPTQPSLEDLEKINEAFKQNMIKNDPSLKQVFDKYPAYQPVTRLPLASPFMPPKADSLLTPQELLLAAGWGYCTVDPASIQADNGAGLTQGIIGLMNKGHFRSPEDWGSLRAWAWGASRVLDYLTTEPNVDVNRVGIEGVSRYGKAALITLAFEARLAMGLIGSSGKGGATLHRRNFGEAVENLTGSGEYHWMAGNYLKYGTEESRFGKMTACNMEVDAHQLIALCAPRLCFISYGIPASGDAHWLDQKGSYMAVVAAGEAYRLLGVGDLGVSNDPQKEIMPPVLQGLLKGKLAWRQHDGGHTDAPNFKYFIPWANKNLAYEKQNK